jgi:hypothetical protein
MSRRNDPLPNDEWDLAELEQCPAAQSDPGAEDRGHEEDRPAWDADDERRQKDCFAPPKDPCECYCLHCRRTFMSDQIWLQRIVGDPQGMDGFWMCPTPNCSGAGFTFDIFPTDPAHPANAGWTYDDDDEDDEDGEDADAEEEDGVFIAEDDGDPDAPWDPDETLYKQLDEAFGDEPDDDIEGEEWKYGLAPGERPPEPDWVERGRREREEQERRYDEPDERPRVLDWSDREDRKPHDGTGQGPFADDDIPF